MNAAAERNTKAALIRLRLITLLLLHDSPLAPSPRCVPTVSRHFAHASRAHHPFEVLAKTPLRFGHRRRHYSWLPSWTNPCKRQSGTASFLRALPVALVVAFGGALAWEEHGSIAAAHWLPYAVCAAFVLAAVLLAGVAVRPSRPRPRCALSVRRVRRVDGALHRVVSVARSRTGRKPARTLLRSRSRRSPRHAPQPGRPARCRDARRPRDGRAQRGHGSVAALAGRPRAPVLRWTTRLPCHLLERRGSVRTDRVLAGRRAGGRT